MSLQKEISLWKYGRMAMRPYIHLWGSLERERCALHRSTQERIPLAGAATRRLDSSHEGHASSQPNGFAGGSGMVLQREHCAAPHGQVCGIARAHSRTTVRPPYSRPPWAGPRLAHCKARFNLSPFPYSSQRDAALLLPPLQRNGPPKTLPPLAHFPRERAEHCFCASRGRTERSTSPTGYDLDGL